LSVNKELIILYWNIGKVILEKQKMAKWGSGIVRKLSEDLRKEFPNMKGFSYTNIKYMKRFAESYLELLEIGQTLSGQILNISWSHNVLLLEKLQNKEKRDWYVQQTIKNGWVG